MPFQLPEYDQAFASFVHEGVTALARARSPMLAQTRRETSPGTGGSVVEMRGGDRLEMPMKPIEYGLTMSVDAIRVGDFGALITEYDRASDELARQLVAMLVGAMEEVTDHTGQVVRSSDPVSFDAIYEGLDRMEWSLKPNGDLALPNIFMHPDAAKKLEQLLPLTPEQEAKLDALKARKHEELLARRNRRLA
jgi:hypothetical protein